MRNRAKELIDKVGQNKLFYNQVREKVISLENEVKSLVEKIETQNTDKDKLDNVILGCKLILEKLTYESKHKLEEFLTFALRNIFPDRSYSIKLEIKEEAKRPGLEIVLEENGIEQEIKDAVGGGILSVLGLLLQIYYLEVYDLTKIMFIDEGLKEVSKSEIENESYLDNVLAFLKYLSEEKDYRFVIVTHDESVKKYADRTYEIVRGEVK